MASKQYLVTIQGDNADFIDNYFVGLADALGEWNEEGRTQCIIAPYLPPRLITGEPINGGTEEPLYYRYIAFFSCYREDSEGFSERARSYGNVQVELDKPIETLVDVQAIQDMINKGGAGYPCYGASLVGFELTRAPEEPTNYPRKILYARNGRQMEIANRILQKREALRVEGVDNTYVDNTYADKTTLSEFCDFIASRLELIYGEEYDEKTPKEIFTEAAALALAALEKLDRQEGGK